MISRRLLGAGALALFGQAVLGEPGDLPAPTPTLTPLPGRLGASDVAALQDLTTRLRAHARLHGGQADILSTAACHYERLLIAHATDAARASLCAALAELQGGRPGPALKLFELGQIGLTAVRDDPRVSMLTAYLHVESACSLAQMGQPGLARSALAAGRDGWEPPDDFERANMNWLTSLVGLELRQLDAAEPFASTAVRAWDGVPDRRQAVLAEITLALVHVRAGEPRGLDLAHSALTSVTPLRSRRARTRLLPLADALDTRPGSDARDLAHVARQVATTRA